MNQTVDINHATVSSDGIQAALELLKQDRRQGLEALNQLFRSGKPPAPALDGPYDGKLLALSIAPVVDQTMEFITSLWMPWEGKHLNSQQSEGDNIVQQKSRLLLKILFPLYKHAKEGNGDSFRAFVFKTSVSAGKVDADIDTLKLDYGSPDNPKLVIRPIIDEVVQIADGVYLGKVHFKNWFGNWKMIGYFSLRNKV